MLRFWGLSFGGLGAGNHFSENLFLFSFDYGTNHIKYSSIPNISMGRDDPMTPDNVSETGDAV